MTTKKKAEPVDLEPKPGRPPSSETLKVPSERVVRELVEGTIVLDANGNEMRHVPGLRVLARRLGVAHSRIVRIAQSNDCAHRHQLYRKANPEPFDAYDRYANAIRLARENAEATVLTESKSGTSTAEPNDDETAGSRRKPGRPSRGDSPVVPWNEVDNALVLGEIFMLPNGTQSTRYPTARELARRYNVAHSAVVRYYQAHQCERRRETAQQRLAYKTEEKVLEMRATALAVSKDDILRMIDKFLVKFEKALDEDRVRYDVPGDFNTVVRLREFVTGGPDTRQESTTTFTLEMLQERHAQMLKAKRETSPAEMGLVEVNGYQVDPKCLPPGDGPMADDQPTTMVGDQSETVSGAGGHLVTEIEGGHSASQRPN